MERMVSRINEGQKSGYFVSKFGDSCGALMVKKYPLERHKRRETKVGIPIPWIYVSSSKLLIPNLEKCSGSNPELLALKSLVF